jgi:hypothetical protein
MLQLAYIRMSVRARRITQGIDGSMNLGAQGPPHDWPTARLCCYFLGGPMLMNSDNTAIHIKIKCSISGPSETAAKMSSQVFLRD